MWSLVFLKWEWLYVYKVTLKSEFELLNSLNVTLWELKGGWVIMPHLLFKSELNVFNEKIEI